jgi:methylenetetrahydrofolate reductase (NADPH)
MNFKQKLQAGKFALTMEMEPPFGTDCSNFKEKALKLKGNVDAIVVTDQQSAMLKANFMVACYLLKQWDLDPVLQVACCDRNRIALQSDIISASIGDHLKAKAVFDLDSVQLLQVANNLNNGIAMNEKEMDPCDEKIMATLFAANTLLGKDEYCKNYLKAKRDGRLECVSS